MKYSNIQRGFWRCALSRSVAFITGQYKPSSPVWCCSCCPAVVSVVSCLLTVPGRVNQSAAPNNQFLLLLLAPPCNLYSRSVEAVSNYAYCHNKQVSWAHWVIYRGLQRTQWVCDTERKCFTKFILCFTVRISSCRACLPLVLFPPSQVAPWMTTVAPTWRSLFVCDRWTGEVRIKAEPRDASSWPSQLLTSLHVYNRSSLTTST